MKKTIITSAIALIITSGAYAQPVSDRAVVPVAVTLNQILRIKINNGGNIEFVFNNIQQYKDGINSVSGTLGPPAQPFASTAFYQTDVEIASSNEWQLDMGAEDVDFIDVDDVANGIANPLTLNNVGFTLAWGAAAVNSCCAAADDVDVTTGFYTDCVDPLTGLQDQPNALVQYTGPASCILLTSGATGNGGDIVDNYFSLFWECGTGPNSGNLSVASPMNGTNLLDQNLAPHRYVTNVFFELTAI